MWGIGFKTADTIAQAVGIPHDSPERVKAGLRYTLSAGRRRRPLLPARAQPGRRRREDPRGARPTWSPPAWTSWSPRRASVRGARRPRPATASRCPRSTWCRSTAPSCPWPASLLRAAARPATTGWPRFADVDWDAALSVAARPYRRASSPPSRTRRSGWRSPRKVAVLTGGPGCGKSFTVRSIVELARRQEGQGHPGRPDRPGRQAAGRADRPRGHHRAPAAAAAARRRGRLRPGQPARRRPGRGRRGLHARPDPGQQAGQGGRAGRAPAVRRRRRPAALGRRRGGAARPARRRRHPPGAADADLPAGPAVRRRGQRPPHQRRACTPAAGAMPDFFLFPCEEPEADRRADRGRRRPPHPAPVRPGPAPRRAGARPHAPRRRPGAGASTPLLQEALTPPREGQPERRYGGRVFRVGDKVTQLRNNYDKGAAGVFNGTVGVVTGDQPRGAAR